MRRLAVAAAVAVLGALVPAMPASAGHEPSPLPSPDSHGNRAYCNVSFWSTPTASTGGSISCNYGGSITLPNFSLQVDKTGDGIMDANLTGDSWITTTPSAGQTRHEWPDGGGVRTARPEWSFTSCFLRQNTSAIPTSCTETTGTAFPLYPTQYFVGGTVVNPALPDPGTLTCSRRLSEVGGSYVASFTGPTGQANTTDAYSWAWGDGTAEGTTKDPEHFYPAPSTAPAGGWTATVTVTRTANAGYTYGDGSTVKTATCSLRVDFLNPTESAPGGTSKTADDSDCPSGFGWLNPLAIVGILKCLFIPSSSAVSSVGDMFATAKTKAPFSWATEAITFPGDVLGMIIAHNDPTNCTPTGVGGGSSAGGTPWARIPGHSEPIMLDSNGLCGTSGPFSGVGALGAMRGMVYVLFLVALGMGVYRTVVWAIS